MIRLSLTVLFCVYFLPAVASAGGLQDSTYRITGYRCTSPSGNTTYLVSGRLRFKKDNGKLLATLQMSLEEKGAKGKEVLTFDGNNLAVEQDEFGDYIVHNITVTKFPDHETFRSNMTWRLATDSSLRWEILEGVEVPALAE